VLAALRRPAWVQSSLSVARAATRFDGDNRRVTLFSSCQRSDINPLEHGERTFEFLDRAKGEVWDHVRFLMEEFLDHVEDVEAQRDLAARLCSGSDDEFQGAWWELYLHETLRRADHEVWLHPKTQSGHRPDFLATGADGPFYMEATTRNLSASELAEQRRREQFFRLLDQVPTGPWGFHVEQLIVGRQDIAGRRVVDEIRQWLAPLIELDPDHVSRDQLPKFKLADRDWSLCLSLWPRSRKPLPAGRRPRAIVIGPMVFDFFDTSEPIRTAVRKKRRKYRGLRHPLLIAINVTNIFHDRDGVERALFGNLPMQTADEVADSNPAPQSELVQQSSGVWARGGKWINAHIAGVVIAHNQAPWATAARSPELWLHPYRQLERSPVPAWAAHRVSPVGEIVDLPLATSPSSYFQLPDDWPGKPF
jgi:hypothetical protein